MNKLFRRISCLPRKSESYYLKLIEIGLTDSRDELATNLQHSAYSGNKKSLKKVLETGIRVDYPNEDGQTPLFCACLAGKKSIVKYLLELGADPNERTTSGLTPLHAACYSCQIDIMKALLEAGGDTEIRDHDGKDIIDWAVLHHEGTKRKKMLKFLRKLEMSQSGQEAIAVPKAPLGSSSNTKNLHKVIGQSSIYDEKPGTSQQGTSLQGTSQQGTNQHYLRFGQVAGDEEDKTEIMFPMPLLNESDFQNDPKGDNYMNGTFYKMERIWWNKLSATAKRLCRNEETYQRDASDLLMNEVEYVRKLRHPSILICMAVCTTNNMDEMFPVYEKIEEGSLYNYLHEKNDILTNQMQMDLSKQICDGMIYIHQRGLVHCAMTSHAINLVNSHVFKLGNFEFMTEISRCATGKNTVRNAFNRWMAPEVMMHAPPSFHSDMFSFCAVLWEIIYGIEPWEGQSEADIIYQYGKDIGLKTHDCLSENGMVILDHGLQLDPADRTLTFRNVRCILEIVRKNMVEQTISNSEETV